MKAEHFEILVEEQSIEAFLTPVLPRIIGDSATFQIHAYQGKHDLLRKLGARLRAYAKWLPENSRIIVLVDRDDADCAKLKKQLEREAETAGLPSRFSVAGPAWRVANRIAIEELEAWYFGDWAGVRRAYPNVPRTIPNKAAYRSCDAIRGGTWEAFERILRRAGYFQGGLRKVEAATRIGSAFSAADCVSPSFAAFRRVLLEAVGSHA